MTILITTVSVSFARGDKVAFLESCRADVYSSLIADNKVFSALKVRLSQSPPQKCYAQYQEAKRFLIIETKDYLAKEIGDSDYRENLTTNMVEGSSTSIAEAAISNFISKEGVNIDDNGKFDLDKLKGYVNISK